uniref:hypothetical protein n=1 Tax=Rhizorhabdus sp. TaxID=1968843 RepID=UPI001B55DE38
ARRIAEVLGCLLVDLLSEKDNPYRLSDEERRLIKHYRTADEAQKALVSRVAEPLAPVQSDDIARKSAA